MQTNDEDLTIKRMCEVCGEMRASGAIDLGADEVVSVCYDCLAKIREKKEKKENE